MLPSVYPSDLPTFHSSLYPSSISLPLCVLHSGLRCCGPVNSPFFSFISTIVPYMIVFCCVECTPYKLSPICISVSMSVAVCVLLSALLSVYRTSSNCLSFSFPLPLSPLSLHLSPPHLFTLSVFIFHLDVVDFSPCLRLILSPSPPFSLSPSVSPFSYRCR